MSSASRISAFLAYLLPVIGWFYVFIARRDDRLAVYHTEQAIALFMVGLGVFLAWAILGWAMSLIPYLGFIVAVALFSLVIIMLITMLVNWVVGMVYALQAKLKPLPITGSLASSLRAGAARPQPVSYREVAAAAPEYHEVPSYAGEVRVRVIGFGFRLVAIVIDVFLLAFITVVLAIVLSFFSWLIDAFQPYGDDVLFTNLFIVLGLLVSVAYYVGFWAKSGQTIGKSVLGIKVISADGAAVSWRQAFLRYLGYIVSGLIFSIGFLWAAFDRNRQGWHDKIAKTYVVDEDDGFSSESSVTIEHVELGRNWIWLAVWLVVVLIAPAGSLGSVLILGPFINRLITNLFQGL
jgi:uncharacterized RDD family membrane protein YckC/uncharacterized membrane protein